jgi:hypothetical protein
VTKARITDEFVEVVIQADPPAAVLFGRLVTDEFVEVVIQNAPYTPIQFGRAITDEFVEVVIASVIDRLPTARVTDEFIEVVIQNLIEEVTEGRWSVWHPDWGPGWTEGEPPVVIVPPPFFAQGIVGASTPFTFTVPDDITLMTVRMQGAQSNNSGNDNVLWMSVPCTPGETWGGFLGGSGRFSPKAIGLPGGGDSLRGFPGSGYSELRRLPSTVNELVVLMPGGGGLNIVSGSADAFGGFPYGAPRFNLDGSGNVVSSTDGVQVTNVTGGRVWRGGDGGGTLTPTELYLGGKGGEASVGGVGNLVTDGQGGAVATNGTALQGGRGGDGNTAPVSFGGGGGGGGRQGGGGGGFATGGTFRQSGAGGAGSGFISTTRVINATFQGGPFSSRWRSEIFVEFENTYPGDVANWTLI